MTIENDFLPFASAGGANVLSQAAYAALSALGPGFSAGVAPSAAFNKVWRQSSIMSAVIAALIVDTTGNTVIDDGTTATIEANLITSIKTLAAGVAASNVTINSVGGAVVLSSAQYGVSFIYVTGVLANDLTLTFPNGPQTWCVINNTTGAHSVTCKTAAGNGVTVTQGHADKIVADGVNVVYGTYDVGTRTYGDASAAAASTLYVDRAVAQVGGYYQDTGAVANAYIVALIPAIVAYDHAISFRFRTTRANTGAATINAGGGVLALKTEAGGDLIAGDIPTGSIVSVTIDPINLAYAVVNELVPSQLGALARENFGQGLEDDGAGGARVKLADSSLRRDANGVRAVEPVVTTGVNQVIGLADNSKLYVSSAAISVTAGLSGTLGNGYVVELDATGGAITFIPNAADTVEGLAVGASYTLAQGNSIKMICDGAGNWRTLSVSLANDALNRANAVLYQLGILF